MIFEPSLKAPIPFPRPYYAEMYPGSADSLEELRALTGGLMVMESLLEVVRKSYVVLSVTERPVEMN